MVGQHKQLASAIKKLSVGVSRNAVTADLTRRGIDTAFLDLDLSAELPTSLQGQTPLAVEFTELYLDERAFMEHAGSREYLQAYGKVMDPALVNAVPITMRCGTPNESMVEKILDPILKEQVVSLPPGFSVWKRPRQGQVTNTVSGHIIILI